MPRPIGSREGAPARHARPPASSAAAGYPWPVRRRSGHGGEQGVGHGGCIDDAAGEDVGRPRRGGQRGPSDVHVGGGLNTPLPPTGQTTVLHSLPVPEGRYVVTATVSLVGYDNMSQPFGNAACVVRPSDYPASPDVGMGFASLARPPGGHFGHAGITVHGVAEVPAGVSLQVICFQHTSATTNFSGRAEAITALQVETIHR